MAVFDYVAKKNTGEIVRETIKAADANQVRRFLKENSMVEIDISQQRTKSVMDFLFKKSISTKELLIFTKYFSILVKAGIPVMRSLKILEDQTTNEHFKDILHNISEAVMGGSSLSGAFDDYPDLFPLSYRNLIRIGEESGALHEVLVRLHFNLSKAQKLKGKIKGALMYPLVITLVAASVVTFLLVFIIPKFVDIFKRHGTELPFITQMVVTSSEILVKKWYIVIGSIASVMFGVKTMLATEKGRILFDRLCLIPPVFGPLLLKYNVASFASNLDMMSRGGATITSSLKLAIKTLDNEAIKHSLNEVITDVEAGSTLAVSLGKTGMLPALVIQMISVGEETGALNEMLETINEFYEEEIDANVGTMLSLIEPIFILVLGGVVGTIVISMYLPIFKMARTVSGKH